MKRAVLSLLLVLPLTLVLGCGESPSVDQVRWEIERRVPEARFEREEHVRLGRVTFGLIKSLVRMVPGKVEGQEMLTSVDRVEVSTYRVKSLPEDFERRALDDTRFEQQLARAGWSLFIREREKDNQVWMYVRSDREGGLRSLFVVDLDGSELTLVRLDGRLDRALAQAVADDPDHVVRAVRKEGKGEKDEAEPEDPRAVP